jgi:hypothetical protein
MLRRFSLVILAPYIIMSLSSCSQVRTDRITTSQTVPPSPMFLAKPPQKIAVIVLRSVNSYIPDREIEDVFIRASISKGFRVVSRSDIEPLLREMEFQKRSGLTDKDAAELGRILNVPAVMIVAVTRNETYSVSLGARLISVEEAEILWGNMAGSTRPFYSQDILIEVAKGIANTIPQHPRIR